SVRLSASSLANRRDMELGGMHRDSQPPRDYLIGGAIGHGGEHHALAPPRAGTSPMRVNWRRAAVSESDGAIPRGHALPNRALTFSACRESLRWPCSPLRSFRDSLPAGSLPPSSRATLSPSEARRRSLQTFGCLGPLRPASYLASHQELCGARRCFWACIAYGPPSLPGTDC